MQTQESGETAWLVFRKVPLWVILLLLFVVLPSIFSLVALIAQIVDSLYYGQPFMPFMKPADFFVSLLPIIVLITAIVIMRNWRLKTPISSHDKLALAIIAALGFILPYISSGIGAALYGFKPLFVVGIGGMFFLILPNLIAIGSALIMYRASMRFGNRLKYLPVVCGYVGWSYFYLGFNIAGSSTAGIALLFFPIYSLYFFIIGYWVACGIHIVRGLIEKRE
jgi:hypothetical protein